MLVWAGFHLAAPFLWQVGCCLVVILDLISTVRRGQVDNSSGSRSECFLCLLFVC